MRLLLILTMLTPLWTFGQPWTKKCVTYAGDTLSIGDSLKIIGTTPSQVADYIFPKIGYDNRDRMEDLKWNNYRDHLSFMMGQTYEIVRMSRMKSSDKSSKYKPVVVILERYADFQRNVEYVVLIDKALKADVVQIKKQ